MDNYTHKDINIAVLDDERDRSGAAIHSVVGHRADSIDVANSIYEQPWWLDAVAPGRWREISICQGGTVIARLPYVLGKQRGFTTVEMPPFTQALGPWLRPSTAKYVNRLAEQKELMTELIAQLPRVDRFRQHLSPALTNWLPFHWAGFEATVRYTYKLDDLTDLDAVWAGLRENIRREIRKARKIVTVRDDLGLERFVEVNKLTFAKQGMELPYSLDFLRRVDDACAARGARKMLFAEDASGNIHAVIYIVWDDKTAYYILGGSHPDLRSSGAGSLVMWEAIRFASNVTASFDFKGSMTESIERFNRSFGARQVPYFMVSKSSRRVRVIHATETLIRAMLGKPLQCSA